MCCEKAYREGKIDFKKPISCHLYLSDCKNSTVFTAVSYHKWDVCKEVCYCGKKQKLPVYKFLKEPLYSTFWGGMVRIGRKEQLKHSDLGETVKIERQN